MPARHTQPDLSPAARSLLLELSVHRGRRGAGVPLTDEMLAAKLRISRRVIIDLALELISAGHLVVASCDSESPGRFLLLPGDDLTPAKHYLQTLETRGIKILHRRKQFAAALANAERQTSPDSQGQLSLRLGVLR